MYDFMDYSTRMDSGNQQHNWDTGQSRYTQKTPPYSHFSVTHSPHPKPLATTDLLSITTVFDSLRMPCDT